MMARQPRHATTPLSRIQVTCDMLGLTSRAGTALLSGLADAIGLMDSLTEACACHADLPLDR
jgi:hypothetical protein